VPSIGQEALAGLTYIDQLREDRTGVSDRTQGLAGNQLHDTAVGERMLMSAAMGKIELIARIFAETGVKDAFRLILKLICAYQDAPRTIRLTRRNWVAMDPSRWNSDMDMTVRVGMGMGDKDQQLSHAMMLGSLQQQAAPLGFVSADNLRNAAELLVNAMGIKGVDRFFTFPQGPAAHAPLGMKPPVVPAGMNPPAPPPGMAPPGLSVPNPAITQAHIANEAARTQADIRLSAAKAQAEARIADFKARADVARKAFETKADMAIKAQRHGQD
jgi:hypothetical protein